MYARYWAGAIAGLNNGTIENCHVVDSVIAGREGTNPQTEYNYVGGSQIGGITGWNCASGHITDCSVMTTSVLGNRFIGGIAGANNGLIEKTFVRDCAPSDDGSSTSRWIGSTYYKVNGSRSTALLLHENYLLNSQGSNAPYMMVGGLVGSNDRDAGTGTIRNCYVTNTQINSIDGMGELLGANWGVVKNCYTAENGLAYYSNDSWYSGGSRFDWTPDYIARNYNAMRDSTSTGVHYYARETYNIIGTGTRHYMGDGMKTQSTYAGWDFENIWTLDEELTQVNYGYPVFGVSAPAAPTDNEIKNLLANFKVVIDCTNEYVAHEDGEYGLIDGSYTKGSVQGSRESGYTYSIQIQPGKYVEKYNTDTGITHSLDPANQQNVTISFTYDKTAKAWKLAAGTASKATFTVLCDTAPAAPTDNEIKNLLANFKVVIDCTNEYVAHEDGEYGLIDGSYTKGSVQGSRESGYTYSIQIQPGKYVEKYNGDTGADHSLAPENQADTVLTFTFDKETKTWKAALSLEDAIYTVECISKPTVGFVWLSYESNGGTEYPSEQYIQGSIAVLDKVPVREGYYFTGWYRDQELTDRITEIYMVLDRTVYAGWEKVTVPAMLNGSDHFAYITGYADGTVRPDADITRAEVATIFFRLLKDEVRAQYLTSENSFADVNEGDWFNQAVSTMAALGIVDGRTDDRFAPNEAITRAEFAAICARFAAYDGSATNSFTDIAGHWAEDEIACAAALGWVDGYNDGSFRPDKNISRAEAMTLINRVLQRVPENTDDLLDGMTTWVDNTDENMWYYLAVQEATNSHDYVRKGFVYESWTALKADPDWEKYEN